MMDAFCPGNGRVIITISMNRHCSLLNNEMNQAQAGSLKIGRLFGLN